MSNAEKQELLRNAMVFISLRELSLRLRVSRSTLDKWISGKAPMPDSEMFVLLAVLNEIAPRERFTDAVKVKRSLRSRRANDFRKRQKSRNRYR